MHNRLKVPATKEGVFSRPIKPRREGGYSGSECDGTTRMECRLDERDFFISYISSMEYRPLIISTRRT